MKWTRIFSILLFWLLFLPFLVFAQENYFPDVDEYFSKKEKATFERALESQNAFYKKIFPDIVVDLSEIEISVVTDAKDYKYKSMQKKVAGYYSSSYRELVIFKTEKFKHAFMQIMFHELSHALLHLYSGDQFDRIPP